jgi:hypothetical protein
MMNAQARSLLAGVYESAGFTLDDVSSNQAHTNYSTRLLELESIFQVCSQHELRYGTIPILSRTSHIPVRYSKTGGRIYSLIHLGGQDNDMGLRLDY